MSCPPYRESHRGPVLSPYVVSSRSARTVIDDEDAQLVATLEMAKCSEFRVPCGDRELSSDCLEQLGKAE